MATHYRLYPPFLFYPEENDFSAAWERFCCKLLNLEHQTAEIYKRQPPEQGVDLYFPSRKIAFQCKSVESGKSGDFNVTQAVDSFRAAQAAQRSIGWERYVLCANVALTGKQEASLKKAIPDLAILSNSHWVHLCENFPTEVERNFRRLIEIPVTRLQSAIDTHFISAYSDALKKKLETSSIDIFLYCNRHDTSYRVPVSESFTIRDLLEIFRAFFKLPESQEYRTDKMYVSISYSIVFDGQQIPLSKTLGETGIKAGSILTYWTTFVWKDLDVEARGNVVYLETGMPRRSQMERKNSALASFAATVRARFSEFDSALTKDIS